MAAALDEQREVKRAEQVTEEMKDVGRPLIPALHPVLSVNAALPLDEWRVSPTAPLSEGSMHSRSEEACLELAQETALPTAGLRLSDVRQEQMSSIVLNLKVSQVLLQQGNASLDVAESYLQNRGGGDEVDCREAAPPHPPACRSAVGPPSHRYRRPPRPLAKTLQRKGHDGEEPHRQERPQLTFGMVPPPLLKNDSSLSKYFVQTNKSSCLIKKGLFDIHPRSKHEVSN